MNYKFEEVFVDAFQNTASETYASVVWSPVKAHYCVILRISYKGQTSENASKNTKAGMSLLSNAVLHKHPVLVLRWSLVGTHTPPPPVWPVCSTSHLNGSHYAGSLSPGIKLYQWLHPSGMTQQSKPDDKQINTGTWCCCSYIESDRGQSAWCTLVRFFLTWPWLLWCILDRSATCGLE